MLKDKELNKLLMMAGLVSVSYGAYTLFINKKTSNASSSIKAQNITVEITRKIMQEIKHQLLISCISFAEGIKKHIGKQIPESEKTKVN
jgi:hypothetical protein